MGQPGTASGVDNGEIVVYLISGEVRFLLDSVKVGRVGLPFKSKFASFVHVKPVTVILKSLTVKGSSGFFLSCPNKKIRLFKAGFFHYAEKKDYFFVISSSVSSL